MKTTAIIIYTLLVSLLLMQCAVTNNVTTGIHNLFSDEEMVDFYPAYGYKEGDSWVIPLKLYVYEDRGYLERVILSIFQQFGNLTPEERDIFHSRIRTFAADSESGEIVEFVFDRDPANERFTIRDSDGNPVRTDLNGIIEGEIRIPAERAAGLLEAQNSSDGWLTFKAVSNEHSGKGKVRLIDPEGISVISDIDDTIKISEMPAGSRIAVKNAFFKEYTAAPGMADLYKQWRNTPVHYVSGTPRQFYQPLAEFLLSERIGFPNGTFHLRDVRKNLLSLDTWGDIEDIITNENVTYKHKLEQITKIMQDFPDRAFILVGDSGQYDPEIFREVDTTFPGRVIEIIIRDITNDRDRNPQRFEGMSVIPAKAVEEGVSEFD